MHDVVTHRLSLMVLHAGALGVTSPDPAVRTAAEDIRREGALALDELRDLVGVLRNGTEVGPRTLSPEEPGDPARLVEESRSVGVATELTVVGDPAQAGPGAGRRRFRGGAGGGAAAGGTGRRALRRGPGPRRRVPGRCDTARLRPDGGRHAL